MATRLKIIDPAVTISTGEIGHAILLIRGHRVLLDRDLARLYGVATKILNKAVKRNADRFPGDFMIQLTKEESDSLRFHFGTLKRGQHSTKSSFIGAKRTKRSSLKCPNCPAAPPTDQPNRPRLKPWTLSSRNGLPPRSLLAAPFPNRRAGSSLPEQSGLERIAMIRHGINDIRLFYENDVRFLRQF